MNLRKERLKVEISVKGSSRIQARNNEGLTYEPISPCGTCRQAMVETETRGGQELRILLYGRKCVYVINGISTLLPLTFSDEQL